MPLRVVEGVFDRIHEVVFLASSVPLKQPERICFAGISVLTLPGPAGPRTLVQGVEPLHAVVIDLLGPALTKMYRPNCTKAAIERAQCQVLA